MKATGIVRRIDELGRVVIPKEIRRTLRIREGDPLEIFTDRDGEVILKKYSPIRELEDFAKEYAESLYLSSGHIVCVTDKDAIVAVSGAPKKDFMDRAISGEVDRIMNEREKVIINRSTGKKTIPVCADEKDGSVYTSQVIVPIISAGDVIGSVMILSREEGVTMGQTELKLAETAAGFVGRQLGQ
ncbi:MAG TPA: stage V sporulation protein T [Clostridia bacterium]|nr:stage V sporulation protein T [Clostridia bacterium]